MSRARQKQKLCDWNQTPVFSTKRETPTSFQIFSRQRFVCKDNKDVRRRKSSAPLQRTNQYGDSPQASWSMRPIGAVPNACQLTRAERRSARHVQIFGTPDDTKHPLRKSKQDLTVQL